MFNPEPCALRCSRTGRRLGGFSTYLELFGYLPSCLLGVPLHRFQSQGKTEPTWLAGFRCIRHRPRRRNGVEGATKAAPAPHAGAPGVGETFWKGGFCRHLWSVLETEAKTLQDRASEDAFGSRCGLSNLSATGSSQSPAHPCRRMLECCVVGLGMKRGRQRLHQ